MSRVHPQETHGIQDDVNDRQDKGCGSLLAQCAARCAGNREKHGGRNSETHHEGDEGLDVAVVHPAPKAGEIPEKQAGEDGRQGVGEYLYHLENQLRPLPIRLPCALGQSSLPTGFGGQLRN
jgi:hypothetical protein